MIVIRLKGGLGNQMFQYAFASILSAKKNKTLKIDNRFFDLSKTDKRVTAREFELDVFDNSYQMASAKVLSSFENLSKLNKLKRKLRFNYPKKYNEPNPLFQQHAYDIKTPVYINGYFQSYKYYKGYEDLLRNIFSFPIDTLDKKNKTLLSNMKTQNTISVHVRRTDYVNVPKVKSVLGVCSLEYYMKAIDLLTAKYKDAKLVFFSDDSAWVKETFSNLKQDKVIVDYNLNKDSWKDMCLMSFCSHNIIANSSFSWWAAWLNANPNKDIVAPKKWYASNSRNAKDLIPPEWIQL